MLQILTPAPNERIFLSKYTLVWIKLGVGIIEVDFTMYADFENRFIFLAPGQYIRFLTDGFVIGFLEFSHELAATCVDFRVLFKHLTALGYIEFLSSAVPAAQFLTNAEPLQILNQAAGQWFRQNPFQASRDEYQLMFNVKDEIDAHFAESISIERLISPVHTNNYQVQRLIKDKLGLSVKHLALRKLLTESQRIIAFTDKPIQETAADLGFSDPAYFSRFFKAHAGIAPSEFRASFGAAEDSFISELLFLVRRYHASDRSTAFYAKKMNTSVQTLSRKIKDRLQTTAGELVRIEMIASAKMFLPLLSVKETAVELGFRESNHFSAFFKKYTNLTPLDYVSEKSNL